MTQSPAESVPVPPPSVPEKIRSAFLSTHAAMTLWCAGIIATGFLIDIFLPLLSSESYGRLSVLYALAVGAMAVYIARRHSAALFTQALRERSGAVALLLSIAVMTALGTLVIASPDLPKFLDFHNGFAMRGLLGLLGGMQVAAILNRASWRHSTTGLLMVVAHGGVLLILSGAALDASFGQRGIIRLHEGGESAVFSKTEGLSGILTGETGLLDAAVRLENIRTEYHPRRVFLRLYRDGVFTASYEVRAGLRGAFGDILFEVSDYLPHAVLSRTVSPSATPTGKAAAMVTIDTPQGRHSDWLFTEKSNYGFIRRPEGPILVRFLRQDRAPDHPEAAELQIDADAVRWRQTGPKTAPGKWKALPPSLTQTIDGVTIHVGSFIKQATVENKVQNLSSAPEIPVISLQLDREGEKRSVTLSPLLRVPLRLDAHMIVVPTLTESEPSAFTSTVSLLWPDGRTEKRLIQVNSPLKIGACRLYQSDFDREDPSFSGFSVNCSPGAWVAKSGMALMICGLFGAALILLRMRRTKKTEAAP